MKGKKSPFTMRGKIAMVIVALVGFIYWIIGKLEVIIAKIQEDKTRDRKL